MKRLICILSFALVLVPSTIFAQEENSVSLPTQDKGLWFAAQLAPAAAFANGTRATIAQIDLLVGYKFSEFFKVGVGVTPRYVAPVNENVSMMFPPAMYSGVDIPVVLDLRGSILSQKNAKVAPFWSLDAGYTIGQGPCASPTLGVRIGKPKGSFLAGLKYMFQYYGGALNVPAHAVGLSLGYEF